MHLQQRRGGWIWFLSGESKINEDDRKCYPGFDIPRLYCGRSKE